MRHFQAPRIEVTAVQQLHGMRHIAMGTPKEFCNFEWVRGALHLALVEEFGRGVSIEFETLTYEEVDEFELWLSGLED